jgi:hypothetical protein
MYCANPDPGRMPPRPANNAKKGCQIEEAADNDVRRFHTEAESAANLDHSGIVPITRWASAIVSSLLCPGP